MTSIDSSTRPDLRVAILLAPEFSALPLAGFLDTLRHAADDADHSRQRYCSWSLLSHDMKPVRSSSGVEMLPDRLLDLEELNYDYIVIHGGRLEGLADVPVSYLVYLKQAATAGVSLVGLDSGSFVLAEAGLLNGYRASIHWRHQRVFARRYPRCHSATGRLFTIDRDRITCPGGTAAIDLAVDLISRHCGRQRALKGMADLLVDEPRGAHHQLRSYRDGHDPGTDPRLQRAVAIMRERLGQPIPIDVLARVCGTSERQLNRLFHQHYSESPARYWRLMRLDHAAWRLVNSYHSLELIADECGFSDASHFSTAFKLAYRCSPRQYRKCPPGASIQPARKANDNSAEVREVANQHPEFS
ncbi:MAG: AraC family transcriptional regulator [marine bacterium B5-7]|nr:MAG: AraC family transcriptional regulator [marine bacterium B5-7]